MVVHSKDKKTKLQAIIDCQVLQTSDRKRGMGFYLKSLLASVAEESGASSVDWIFLLNGRMPDLDQNDKALLDKFKGRLLKANFLHQGDHELFDEAAPENRAAVDKVVKPLIEAYKGRTVFYIPAMFSREIYPVFPTQGTANMMLFHDLIPFLYHRQYFRDHEGEPRKDYAMRFREVYKTDLFVANSQTTADDMTIYLGIDPSRIVPVFGAAADRKNLKPTPPKVASQLKDGFVFMPSGDDFRKNNVLAAQAFAALKTSEKLVVTSNFGAESQRTLHDICPNIVFAGSVPDEEMLWFFKEAKAVYYPPLYEGFALPLFEAIEANATVACSNISVFAEVSHTAFFYFDPNSAGSMTEALKKALGSSASLKKERVNMKREYPTILDTFTWAKTAVRFLHAVKECQLAEPKPKLALFCPSPSSYSSVGKYAFEVHGELSRLYDIDYYIEEGQTEFDPVRPNILEYAANYFPAGSFSIARASRYDRILYHIGNSEFHVDTILNSLRLPANAIVHDTRLNGIFDYMKNHGFITAERRDYEALLDRAFNCKRSSCLASIATNQSSLICHSRYAEKAIGEVVSKEPPCLQKLVHPIGVPAITLVRSSRPTISFAGIISEDKGIHLVSEISKIDDVRVRVFGFGVLGDSPLLQGLTNVEVITDLSDKEFQDAVRSSNILINYRPNYHGETSRSALEAMRYGTVVIVKDIGWFGELPDNTVMKVKNEIEVLDAVRDLVEHPQKRRAIGEAAREFLGKEYAYQRYAHKVKDSIEGNK
jgi:glycosyltransferase involved in cell wall biosynthesis